MANTCQTPECIQTQISNIQNNANRFSTLQNQIDNNYQNTNNLLDNYNTNLSVLAPLESNPDIYEFNDANSYIPNKYVVSQKSNRPDYTINDGIKRDLDQLIFQQNSIYVLGTITAATLLFAGIFLAR
jgi:hypothetical protein